jgi:uncharacterized protein (DUF488 family)
MIWTIGHSNHPIDRFLALLQGAQVGCVADVRSVPFSRRFPQFSQKALAASLEGAGIEYWFLGDALGARPKDPECYVDGKASYARIAATAAFRRATDALIEKSATTRIALMCAEKEPLDCHRTILVGRELAARGMDLRHLHAEGRIEPQAALEERLLRLARERVDLLGDRNHALARAYGKRAERMAYAAD